jgi:spore germination protein GerM
VRQLVGWLTAAALIVAGCGVPTENGARSIDPDDVPFGLLGQTSTTTTTAPGQAAIVEVFLVGEGRLVPVPRAVADATSVQARLDALLNGPTEQEAQFGVTTALASSSGLAASVNGNTAQIDFGEASGIPGLEQVLAIAQLVFTATAIDGIDQVLFLVGERPVEAPAQDGTLKSEPLTRRDFDLLAPH